MYLLCNYAMLYSVYVGLFPCYTCIMPCYIQKTAMPRAATTAGIKEGVFETSIMTATLRDKRKAVGAAAARTEGQYGTETISAEDR